jgi:hypothetical protein
MARATLSRTAHDLGLAAWFGGTLANAVALNAAAGAVSDAKDAGRVANAGWNRWTPVNFAAIAAHVAGSIGQLYSNKSRLAAQEGVARMSIAKTLVTVSALGVTYYSRVLGRRIADAGAVPLASGTEPTKGTPPEVVDASSKLNTLQWVIPALTGVLVFITSFAGEQQRASEVSSGVLGRFSRSS